jgi:hypothetical protein
VTKKRALSCSTVEKNVYFDTNAFRAIGRALRSSALADDLRDHVLVSPISAFEVISQLCTAEGEEVLCQIQAIHRWVDPKKARLLPWPDDALGMIGFGLSAKQDDFTQGMQRAFNVCLSVDSAETLREEACRIKDVMDAMRMKTAEDFGRMLAAGRKESTGRDWFADRYARALCNGIARRVGGEPDAKPVSEIENTFGAYFEFERVKLETALAAENYNPQKHGNDLLDAEQLVYLGSPDLHFLTCDKGFARVQQSPQATRISIVSPADLSDHARVEALLRNVTD